MFFLNLSLGQFAALFASASAVVIALYLFERSRRRQTVATLRFWVAADEPVTTSRRRKVQQRLSLLLQLLSLALLLLAISQLRIGARSAEPFDHVVILDTSAWMAAQTGRGQTLLDDARRKARDYVRALPASDRVMLVRADGLATAATGFETDRRKLEQAIAASRAGATALNLEQAFQFARHTQSLSARRAGEIVFIGAGRLSARESLGGGGEAVPRLRVIPVADALENCGLRRIGLRRPPAKPGIWEIFVAARNYGRKPQRVTVGVAFGGAPAGSQMLLLEPGAEQEAVFEYRTRAAGLLEARLLTRDAFPDDDRAIIELPEQKQLRVAVYSDEPATLRPILEADPRVVATFLGVAGYTPKPAADLVILDRFRPPAAPQLDAIWIDPPPGASPVPEKRRVTGVRVTAWSSDHPIGEGLRRGDLPLESAAVLEPAAGDVTIALSEAGPVIVARPGKPRVVVIGFHPTRTAMRFELVTPLLFANTLRWMAPDVFRRWEFAAGAAGSVSVPLDAEAGGGEVRVRDQEGRPLPFAVHGRTLQWFTGVPGTVRVTAADREMVYSLTLPEVGESRWEPPATARRGVPAFGDPATVSYDAWPALAGLGGLGLLIEWLLFGRYRRVRAGGRR